MSPDSTITLINSTAVSRLDDAYVICTTAEPFAGEDLLNEFGRHYVEIRDVDLFHFRVTKALRAMEGTLYRDQCGWVTYAPTTFTGLSQPPGDLGFVKEPDIYSSQNEWRFLWETSGTSRYRSHAIGVSGIAELCTLHLDS